MLVASLTGCAVNPPLNLDEVSTITERHRQLAVPFFAQTAYQCGPASLAGVLAASGVAIRPEELTPQVFLPERKGSLQVELMAATRRLGRIAYVIDPEVESLMAEMAAGRPILVLQNLLTRSVPKWHYAVLTGHDTAANELVLNSGKKEGKRLSAEKFLRTWDWAGRWGMVVLVPGEMPANPDSLAYIESVANFEQVAGAPAATPAWEAALKTWPDNHRVYLALGNNAYRNSEKEKALKHYQAGLQIQAADPALENNLATVLGELGCPQTAHQRLQSVYQELDAASPWRGDIDSTLAALAAQGHPDPPSCSQWMAGDMGSFRP